MGNIPLMRLFISWFEDFLRFIGLSSLLVPVLDVFGSEEDKAFWSAKYSGTRGIINRGIYKYYETLSPSDRVSRGLSISRSWKGLTDEQKKARYGKGVEAIRNMSKEARVARSKKSLKSYNEKPEEEKQSLRFNNSECKKTFWINKREEILESQAAGRRSMTKETLDSKSLACSISAKARWASYSPDKRSDRILKALSKGGRVAEPELILGFYLDRKFSGEWAYNGQGQMKIYLGGKVPDYVNVKGRKAVIEVLGIYYHPEKDENLLIDHYKSLGYECIIIWEYDAYLEEALDVVFGVN